MQPHHHSLEKGNQDKNTAEQGSDAPKQERRKTDFDSYFNAQFDAQPVEILPGQMRGAHNDDSMLVANLGSGIVMSVHDRKLQMGFLAYILMPQLIIEAFPNIKMLDQDLVQRAFAPIDACIQDMQNHGVEKEHIFVRLMGGAELPGDQFDCGTKNYVLVREYISRQGIAVLNEDIGGHHVRRVHFFPASGRAIRLFMKRDADFTAMQALENEFHV